MLTKRLPEIENMLRAKIIASFIKKLDVYCGVYMLDREEVGIKIGGYNIFHSVSDIGNVPEVFDVACDIIVDEIIDTLVLNLQNNLKGGDIVPEKTKQEGLAGAINNPQSNEPEPVEGEGNVDGDNSDDVADNAPVAEPTDE